MGKQAIVETLSTLFFEVWIWLTVGLIAIIAFFGKRMVAKWDLVIGSHMPNFEIEKRFLKLNEEMSDCQEEIKQDQKDSHDELMVEVKTVHSRLDNLYELLLQRREK